MEFYGTATDPFAQQSKLVLVFEEVTEKADKIKEFAIAAGVSANAWAF